MTFVATVNNTPVHSDKTLAAVTGTRVTFTDGSWCDTTTGEIHNTGPGYIDIGGAGGKATETTTKGPARFVDATALEIRGITATVRIDVHDGPGIEYTATGPAGALDAISADVRGRTLVVEGDTAPGAAGVTVVGGGAQVVGVNFGHMVQRHRGRTVVTGPGAVVVSGNSHGSIMTNVFGRGGASTVVIGAGGADVEVTVKIPRGTPVTLDRIHGDVAAGDTGGPLAADVQGHDVTVGSVTSAQVTVQGSGDVTVSRVDGPVSVQVQGSGSLDVRAGSMPSLVATVQGSGEVRVAGTAETATLTVQGSGDIDVARVVQRPMKNVQGNGRIRVRRIG